MSISAVAWALQQKVTPPTRKFVLVVLAEKADHEGRCWPSVAQIAETVGIGERAARKQVTALADAGLICAARNGPKANAYQLAIDRNSGSKDRNWSSSLAGTVVPLYENKDRNSGSEELPQKTGTGVPKDRNSGTVATNLINRQEPSVSHLRERRTRVGAREDMPEWLKTLTDINPGVGRNGVRPDDDELKAWVTRNKITPEKAEETALYIASAWNGKLRSRSSVRHTFQNLVKREWRQPGGQSPSRVRQPESGRRLRFAQ